MSHPPALIRARGACRMAAVATACLATACGGGSAGDGAEAGSANAVGGAAQAGAASSVSGAGNTGIMASAGTGGDAPMAGGGTATGGSGGSAGSDASGAGGASGAGPSSAGAGGTAGPALAFPGAVGVARNATGGRGGSVYHVTTLADSGAGSFRDAVGTAGRIIVFDVGGYINLQTAVAAKSNLTIAGQTAPGDGIGIMGREVSFSGAKNVIARYLRFRQGDLDPASSKSGINLLDSDTMIFDHVSIEFAQWNNIDAVGAKNITVQYSISANPIGQQFAAHTEAGPYTWYRNLFANAHNRNPLAKANTQYIDNVVYDFQAGYTAGNSAGKFSHDVIDNYFIAGPATTSASNAFFQVNAQLMFAKGNYLDQTPDGTLNGEALAIPGAASSAPSAWSPDTAAIPTTGAANAYAVVAAQAGASLHRDEVDSLVVADLKSLGKSGHLWTHQTESNLSNSGYGSLQGGQAPTDSDADGMPDSWETKYGLDPKSASDARSDFDHTGYTNLEKYVNSLADQSYPE